MNADAVDAADILVTELSEQAAMLSQSGVAALSSGQLAQAKAIISAIEQTQFLRSRAEQLKGEIADLYSNLVPSVRDEEMSVVPDLESSRIGHRTQDRTDPVLMNKTRNLILRTLEHRYSTRLSRRSAAVYRSESGDIGVVCTISKWYPKHEYYWYAFHTHQEEFLSQTSRGYFVLGMMDLDRAVSLPLDVVRQNMDKLNTTITPDGGKYWHVHVLRTSSESLLLYRAKGEEPLALDRYIIDIES